MPATRSGDARLFLALWPGPAARQALARWHAAVSWPATARPVVPERCHVTLHFIGAVPWSRVAGLVPAFGLPAQPFTLRLQALQHWPGGLLVLTPSEVPEALRSLHRQLAEVLRQEGLPVESRPFRPHLTLARRAAGIELPGPPPSIDWRVAGHALVSSEGSYRTLAHYRWR